MTARGGPRVSTVDGLDDLPAALAGMTHGTPVLLLIGGAAGLEGATGETLLPLVRDGVMAAAAAAGATVVDGGTDSGVMALAGRARAELEIDVALVGVTPRARSLVPDVDGADGSTPLEPHHSHVLLVPGAEWGEESPWLLEVARRLAGERAVAAVVVDGGPVAMSEALDCAEAGWPVVAVSGSGRSADVLARRSGIISYAMADGPDGLATMLRGLLLDEGTPLAETAARKVDQVAAAEAAGEAAVEAAGEGASELAGDGEGSAEGLATQGPVDYPALYTAASEAAKRGQRIHRRLTLAEVALSSIGLLIALFVASFAGPLGLDDGSRTGLIIAVVALSFLTSLVVKLLNRSSGFDTDWHAGRGLAETVKSLAWRYMMRSRPYDQPDADRRFRVDMAGLLRRGAGFRQAIDRLPERPQQISAQMRAVRGLGLRQRRDLYLARRVYEQADWYRRRSASSQRSASRAFWGSLGFQLAAAGAALFALVEGVDVLRVMATLGAVSLAFTAWSQANRFDELAGAYAAGVQELLLIAAVAEGAATEEEVHDIVQESEEAIGREQRLWMAKRAQPMPSGEEEEIEDDAD